MNFHNLNNTCLGRKIHSIFFDKNNAFLHDRKKSLKYPYK